MHYLTIDKEEWDKALEQLLVSYRIIASMENEFGQDYEEVRPGNISGITYNKPKPATPLKTFFLPVRENVSGEDFPEKPIIIIGVPNCDIEGAALLDEIYLNREFNDPFYRKRRENTIIIGSDCFGIQEHCHCLSYNIKPWPVSGADLAVIRIGDKIVFRVISKKGEDLMMSVIHIQPLTDTSVTETIEKEHGITESLLKESNKGLPDYIRTGLLVRDAKEEIWKKYASTCVSCGACTTACPTCTCFLLIDKPGFEKVRQTDACQYPGFERVAGGEDGLFELPKRFRNRYMCKYVWKPQKFNAIACTGCGRCIEACIGKISKNKLFMELA
jgi:sulfhydrogenase subunit beta (sulfur reductase)